MARMQAKKTTFSRGVISEKLIERDDLELFEAGLADGKNYVVDGRGGLEKRPGTMHLAPTKDNGFATLLPFAYSRTQAYAIEAGHQYFRFFSNYAHVLSGGTPLEVATPYGDDDVERISHAQSNDVMFLACKGYKYARLVRTGAAAFQLASFDTYDGPYLEMNPTTAHKLAATAADNRITATGAGFAPFTAAMVGRWIRIRSPNTDSEDANELGDEFLWDFFQITSYVSPTVVVVDNVPGNIAATADWRLGAFYGGNWPDVVGMHGGRLWFGKGNRAWGSKPQDFNNFSPTYHSPQGGATGRVEPDSSISVVIDSGLSQQGAVTEIYWFKSQNFQLVLGTPVGVITLQSTSFGEALTPSNIVARAQDARGASDTLPVTVHESTVFVHTTGQRLQGTYYRDGSYDRLGAQDLSLSADTLITDTIRRLTWQDFPHGAVWACMVDGHALTLSLQPEQNVQGWMPQQFGGQFINQGAIEHPHCEALLSLPSPDGKRDDVYQIVRRTIEGEERRYVEVLRPFWRKGTDVRNSWFLDSALRYDGNDEIGKTITLTQNPAGPNEPWILTTSFASPVLQPASKFSIFDGRRWHYGTIIEVDGSNNALWLPSSPNAQPGPADGLRWFFDEAPGQWVQPVAGDPDYFRPAQNTYEAPADFGTTWRWSIAVSRVTGLDHLIGQTVEALVDGMPSLPMVVDGAGGVDLHSDGCTVLVGLPYNSDGKLLPINEGAQAGTADEKQRPIYASAVSVFETWGLECGSGQLDTYGKRWEQYEQTVYPQAFADGEPPPLFTGYKHFSRQNQLDTTNPVVAFRHRYPLPCYVRAIINRISTSDGA